MNNKIFESEKLYLNEVKTKINNDIIKLENLIKEELPKIEEEKLAFQNEKGFLFSSASTNFDTYIELDQEFNHINDKIIEIDNKNKEKHYLAKLVDAPYFGRVDVIENASNQGFENYIGLKSVAKNDFGFYVIDWRTPIAGLFYDNSNNLSINTSTGKFNYNLINKRQYKITDGELQFYFDSNIKIDDEILQEVLGKSTSEKMRNIVASIQEEQNKVIRFNEFSDVYVLGVAGSGKTSIALHRIAYLLYKLEGKIKSKDIIVLSPNNVFSDYISNVLPELNEENMSNNTLDNMLLHELKNISVESKQDSIERILLRPNSSDDTFYKHTYEFLEKLINYLENHFKNSFKPKDIKIDKFVLSSEELLSLIEYRVKNKTLSSLITSVTDAILKKYFLRILSNPQVRQNITKIIKSNLYEMFGSVNPYKIYTNFLNDNQLSFNTINGKIKHEDAFAILLVKFWIFSSYGYHYKHLVVDEVQDYSAVQLFLINWLFRCPKTVLGDTAQTLNYELSKDIISKIKSINALFKNKVLNEEDNSDFSLIRLNKSYRNGYEITKLANSVINLQDVEYVKREGFSPKLLEIKTQNELISQIIEFSKECKKLNYKNYAILTKNNSQAQKLYSILKDKVDINLITSKTKKFTNGLSIMSTYLSKGLEFDAVFVYNVNDKSFNSEFDRHLLYIAITRALNFEWIAYTNQKSEFIKDYFDN